MSYIAYEEMNHIEMSSNTFVHEVIPVSKNRFYPKLPNKVIDGLDYLFCVGSAQDDGCFSINLRSTQMTHNGKKKFGLGQNHKMKNMNDWNNVLKDKEVLLVTGTIDKYNNGDYKIKKAKVVNMKTLEVGFPYRSTSVTLDVDGKIIENITLKRVFIPAEKTSPLNVNAPAFIPTKKKKSTLNIDTPAFIPAKKVSVRNSDIENNKSQSYTTSPQPIISDILIYPM